MQFTRAVIAVLALGLSPFGTAIAQSSPVQVSYRLTSEWGGGFCGAITVTNPGAASISGWSGSFTLPDGKINQLWNASWAQNGSTVSVSSTTWNASLAAKASISSVGFCAERSRAASSASAQSASVSSSAAASSAAAASSSAGSAAAASAWDAFALSAAAGPQGITLQWAARNAGTVEVYRDTDANPSGRVRIATPANSAATYLDRAVAGNTTYYYWIKQSVNGVVSNSRVASATTAQNAAASSASSSSVSSSAASSSSFSSSVSSSSASSVSSSSASSVSSSSSSSTPSTASCSAYSWPKYTPDLNYDIKTDTTNTTVNPANFKLYLGCNASLVAGYKTSGRFAFIWGKNRNPAITDAHIDALLAHMNKDADYIHNTMGWPVDKLQQQGYFSNVYLFGSGLCTDSASNTEKGGWQSGLNGYPMVLLSYYPVITASEFGGVTHEYIHAIMASMGNKAAWFNEGSNTWLQMTMEGNRSGNRGVGFLDGAPFLAPHMPIENYSGWLQDGTFGGPNAEGVHMETASGQQIGTWREYLGGNQYNAAFSHFIALNLSKGSNAWIWKKGTKNHILASLADGLGDAQTRRLITEYRARQAMVDFGEWTNGFKAPINNNWARTIVSESSAGGLNKQTSHKLSFYAATTQSGTTLIPATDTLPGWSGANQIPLKVSGNKVRVNFQPLGNNMRFQIAYRAADGTAVYSQPVESGEACLDLTKAPKNGVVVGIATSTDYLYSGEVTRKAKYDYRVHLLEGVTGTAPLYDKHYQ